MKKRKFGLLGTMIIAVFFSFVFLNSGTLLAQDNGPVTVQSKQPFEKTVKEIRKMVSNSGMMVLSEINQGKILSMTGININAESLFIGNPQIGNKLFSADRGVGIAIPVRLNIYEGSDGNTYVSYVKPTVQLASFKNEKVQKIAQMLDGKLGKLTGMLSK